MLPRDDFEPSPGIRFPCFSVAHLTWNALRPDLAPSELRAELDGLAGRHPVWAHAPLAKEASRLLAEPPSAADAEIVERLVRVGHGLGLAAAWGVAPEAELLWAAAAALTRRHGADHPNDLPRPAGPQGRSARGAR